MVRRLTQITLCLFCSSLSHPSLITLSSITYLSLIHFTYSSLPNPAPSPAGRKPSGGGFARPMGKHSRRMTVFCPPSADSRPELERIHERMKTRRVFAPGRVPPKQCPTAAARANPSLPEWPFLEEERSRVYGHRFGGAKNRPKQCPAAAAPKPAVRPVQMKPDSSPREPFFFGIFGGRSPRLRALLRTGNCRDAAIALGVHAPRKLRETHKLKRERKTG
jgi:hypothetical protein